LRSSGMFCALALILAAALGASAIAQTGRGQRLRASLSNLCVTEGAVTALPAHRLLVTDPNVHATMNRETPQDIEAHFVYLGPSNQSDAAPSGPVHHQFGFELFAQDACNLVYVMWRFEPESSIAVSVKSNPSQLLHDECRKRGATEVQPELALPLPPVRAGERASHTLRAQVSGPQLLVFADNILVWRGALPSEVVRSRGPVGIHCDNAKLELMITVAPPLPDAPFLPCNRVAESHSPPAVTPRAT
jgi:hypothetical protein